MSHFATFLIVVAQNPLEVVLINRPSLVDMSSGTMHHAANDADKLALLNRAFGDFLFGSVLLHFFVFNYLG